MTHIVWVIVGIATFAAPGPATEPRAGGKEIPPVEEMERYERGMELKAHETKLIHEQNMRQLDLEQRRAEIEHVRRRASGAKGGGAALLLLLILVTNILLTVWVFKDMHEQEISRALWVPIVLLAGVFGAILYAIVRLGNTRAKPAGSEGKGRQSA